jgi:excisionase family DNA binding protein
MKSPYFAKSCGNVEHVAAIEQTPAYLTALETARLLRRDRDTIYRLLKAGRLPGRKVGGTWLVNAAELKRLLETSDADSGLR